MPKNLIGLILSYTLVAIILLFSTLFTKLNFRNEYNRKFIHITISHWWIIAMLYFDSVWVALIPPITFFIANAFTRRYHLIEAMERKNQFDYGILYYPLSMIFLTLLSFGILKAPYIGAIGIFIMGYGDGLAAVIGKRWGRRKIFRNKTLEGTITMFFSSFFVTFTILMISHSNSFWITSFIVAFIATILEVFSPKGLDNLTVPILTSLLYFFIFY